MNRQNKLGRAQALQRRLNLPNRKAWDEAARTNAMYYTSVRKAEWELSQYFALGSKEVALLRPFFDLMSFDPADKRMLDIGCGLGKMTRAFSSIFGEAYGVDFSTEMLEIAKKLNEDRLNLYFADNNGVDLARYGDNFFDFCFSYAVFQHIPKRWIIRSYICEISRVLKSGGLFAFQVDGRKWIPGVIPLHRWVYNLAVESGIMRLWLRRKTRYSFEVDIWQGLKFSRSMLEDMLRGTALDVIQISGEDTQYMWCYGKKGDRQ